MKKKLTLIATLAMSVVPIFAQEVLTLPEITLSANLDETEVNHSGASVVVIDNKAIKNANKLSLGEFLGQTAGVNFNRQGPLGSATAVTIRGARQYEVKVLVDGVDVSDPSLPQSYYNFASMGMNDVARVEIVKGSQSSIYGGSAVGGVINITSKKAEHDGFGGSVSAETGSYKTTSGALTLTHGGANHSLALSFGKVKSEGFSTADEADGNTEADGFEGNRMSLNASYDLSESFTIGVSGFVDKSTSEYDDAFGGVFDAENVADAKQSAGRVFAKYKTDNMNQEISYSQMDTAREYTTSWGIGGYEASRETTAYLGNFDVTSELGVSLGLEHQIEEIKATGSYGETISSVNSSAATLGVNYAPTSQIDLNVTTRLDDSSGFGKHQSNRITLAYRPSETTTVKASASTGFRAPSLGELFSEYGGNTELEVETTTSYDLGFEQKIGENVMIGMTVFQSETDNKIIYDDSYTYNNLVGKTTRKGAEITVEAKLNENINAHMGYTYLSTKDAEGERLARVPKHELNLGTTMTLTKGLTFGLDAKMVKDVIENSTTPLDDYTLVNARLGYQIGTGEIYGRVENLTDEQYQTAKGYGTSDRAYYVGYRVDF